MALTRENKQRNPFLSAVPFWWNCLMLFRSCKKRINIFAVADTTRANCLAATIRLARTSTVIAASTFSLLLHMSDKERGFVWEASSDWLNLPVHGCVWQDLSFVAATKLFWWLAGNIFLKKKKDHKQGRHVFLFLLHFHKTRAHYKVCFCCLPHL